MVSDVFVGDCRIHDVSFAETVDWIVGRASSGRGGMVATVNADFVFQAHRDPQFRAALDHADLSVPDGMLVVYASSLAGRPLSGTVTGRLLLPALVERCRNGGPRIALFGAGPGVAEAAAKRLEAQYPGAAIVAAIAPPLGLSVGSADDRRSVARLQAADPAVVFVGLGAPKQEIWMVEHMEEMPGTVFVGIGGGLDLAAGRLHAAPRWMTRVGLEWAFRLMQEPRRLGRRYLVDDPWVIWWAMRARLRRRRGLGGGA